MKSFLVTYDLKTTYSDRSDDYEVLYQKLKSYFNYAKITKSSWIIQGNYTAKSLRDDILFVIDSGDDLFVGELTGIAAWNNCIDSTEKIKNTL